MKLFVVNFVIWLFIELNNFYAAPSLNSLMRMLTDNSDNIKHLLNKDKDDMKNYYMIRASETCIFLQIFRTKSIRMQ